MELHLSRQLAQRRIFPAIDIQRSGTRKEELLMMPEQLESIWNFRRMMTGDSLDYTDQFVNMLRNTANNEDFFAQMNQLTQMK